jgi:hypothetical protein
LEPWTESGQSQDSFEPILGNISLKIRPPMGEIGVSFPQSYSLVAMLHDCKNVINFNIATWLKTKFKKYLIVK